MAIVPVRAFGLLHHTRCQVFADQIECPLIVHGRGRTVVQLVEQVGLLRN